MSIKVGDVVNGMGGNTDILFKTLDMMAMALSGRQVEALIDYEGELPSIYALAKRHSVAVLVYYAIGSLKTNQPQDATIEKLLHQWKRDVDIAVWKTVLFEEERERLFAHLNAIGCWYMPLKGQVLRNDYPQAVMREMADFDILFDEKFTEQVHDYMVESGYSVASYQKGYCDEYLKEPFLNMELHRRLFHESNDEVWASYFADIKDRLIPTGPYSYRMSDEDFYLFMTAHEYKHYHTSGIGLRALADAYVFLSAHPQLDWQYVSREMKRLRIGDYEKKRRELCVKVFEQGCTGLSEAEQELLYYFVTSGTFGTTKHAIENYYREKRGDKQDLRSQRGKMRYLWYRLFPSREFMAHIYPSVQKHKLLLPAFYIHRILRSLLVHRDRIVKEYDIVKKL